MHKIFFDSNVGSHDLGYELILSQSLLDLKQIGEDLKEGMKVTLYMPEELEVEAILKFDLTSGAWVAHPSAAYKNLSGNV